MTAKVFKKILVSKYSPENGCFVPDGQRLVILPRTSIPQKDHVAHYFVSASDLKSKCKYGWVKDTAPFTLADFVDKNAAGRVLSNSELGHIETMLASISKLPQGTPVAATYSSRGILDRNMELTVHKVFFYPRE